MTDPFRKFSYLDQSPDDPPPLTEEGPIRVPCKGCEEMLVQDSELTWVHEDEILSLRTSFTKNFHRADPDIIDIEEL